MAFLYTAAQCPPVQSFQPQLNVANTGANPVVAKPLVANTQGPGSQTTPFNWNAKELDAAGIFGGCGGLTAILAGLDLSAGVGALGNIAAGWAGGLGAPVENPAALSTGGLSNGDNHIYIDKSLAVSKRSDLLLPGTPTVYLGRLTVSGGVVSQIDKSGVVEMKGGVPWRFTADVGPPSDSPPASIRLFTETATGIYFWDGAQWLTLSGSAGVQYFIRAGQKVLVPQDFQETVIGPLRVDGILTVNGLLRITT